MQTSMRSLGGLPPKQALALALQERARRQRLALVAQQAQIMDLPPSRSRLDDAHSSLVIREGHPFHDLLKRSRYKVYFGGRDAAKCLALGTKVIMFDGTLRAVEDVRVGEQVMGPDSQPRTVLGTTRSTGPLFEVRQSSGISYVVNENHILSMKKKASVKTPMGLLPSGKYRWPRGRYGGWPDVTNISIGTFAEQSPRWKSNFRGYRAGLIRFEPRQVNIDPYILGVWLGDGTARELRFTSMDKEIIEACRVWAQAGGGDLTFSKIRKSKAYAFGCVAKVGRINPLWEPFKAYGLPNNKHIPQDYIANSERVRLELLAGLLDTDGYRGPNRDFTISQCREQLARQIKYLADTLGFRTSITYKSAKLKGKIFPQWRVLINGDTWRIPCRLPRRKVRNRLLGKDRGEWNKDLNLSKLTVTPAGNGAWAGFTLNGDHLFLLEDGTVTHNSWAFAEALIRRATYEPLRILCTREFQTSIKDSVHKLLKDTIARLGLGDWFDVNNTSITSKAGAEFIFKGIRDSDVTKIKSTEGVDICWVEEAQFTSADSWLTLIPTIRKEGSEIWVSFNVTDEQSPTHKRFITNPPAGIISHFVNYDQNPFLSTESKKEIEWLREVDLEAFNHVYGGLPKKISDAIIFGGRYEVKSFPDNLWEKAKRLHFGGDWGFSQDPSTLIRFFMLPINPEDLTCRVFDLYIEYEAWGIGVEFAGELSEDGRGELERLFDSVPGSRNNPIKADNARPETISFMRGKGFLISEAEKWKGSVEDGISFIKGFRKIFIHPRCKHTIQEAGLYAYKRDKISNEVLTDIIDKHNHCWDGIRYGLDGYIQRGGDLGIWARLGMPQ